MNRSAMGIRITTALDRDAVLNSFRELVAGRGVFVGAVNQDRVSVACRLSALPFQGRGAVFLGRVVSAHQGAVIEGDIEIHWSAWMVLTMWLLMTIGVAVSALLAAQYAASGVALIGTAAAVTWWVYVQGTKRLVVAEVCRASRGSVA